MLVHVDPFAHYTSGQLLRVYSYTSTAVGAPGTFATGPYGRAGGAGFRFSGNYSAGMGRQNIGASGATFVVEVDLRVGATPPVNNTILGVVDAGTFQCTIGITTGLQLTVYQGLVAGGALLGTLGYTVTLGRMVHLSFKVVIGASGSVTLRAWEDTAVTPTATLTLTGVNTQVSGSAQWDEVHIGAACDGDTDWANLVVMDGSTAYLNDLLGPVDVWALWANARLVPEAQEWSPSGGTSHQALIDDGVPDDDLSHLYESSVGEVELTYVDQVPYPDRDILGMQLYACVRKTDTNSPTVAPVARDAGTDYAAAAQSPGSDFAYAMQPYSRMPSGSTFSAAAFDALQWGLEKTA